MQNSNKEKLIYDNSFKWKYVGLMFLIWIIEVIMVTTFCVVANYIIKLACTYLSGENFMDTPPSTINIYFFVLSFILFLIILFVHTLPQMSTGKYRIDNEHLYIQEKLLGKIVTNITIPLKNIKGVSLKTDFNRLSPLYLLKFKVIEIKTKDASISISCYEHKQELYNKLEEIIKNQNN